MPVSPEIADWPRPYFEAGGGSSFHFYVLFGQCAQPIEISASRYRCTAVPEDLDLMTYDAATYPDVIADFRSGYLWDQLGRMNPELAAIVEAQDHCVVLRGELPDRETLNDFRNIVGLIAWMLESGCVALYDPQMFKWWSPDEWRKTAFEPTAPRPHSHVVILDSDDAADDHAQWLHTRGMRRFGRPDLSMRGVTKDEAPAVVEMFNRFIEMQALGAVVRDGRRLSMKGLPGEFYCQCGGDFDDPDFNNRHIEIVRDSCGE